MTQRVATIVCALIAASPGAAQEARPAEPVDRLALPTRVRLTMTNGSRLKVDLLRVEPGGLVVRKPGCLRELSFTVPVAEVSAAQRSLGRRRGRAAGIGALLGAVVGGAVLAASGCIDDEVYRGICLMILVPPPTLLGAGIGALSASERWEPVALPSPTGGAAALSFSPQSSGRVPALGLSFTIRF